MTSQARQLRNLLKKHNIGPEYGGPSVRTETRRLSGGYREWGDAVAHVRELTKKEIETLVVDCPYLSITTIRGEFGFSIVRSGGGKIWETKI
jgi:hypothetical protein